MCNKSVSFGLCPVCGVWIDSYGRCNCNSRKRVNRNEWIVAIALAAVVAVSVFSPAHATGRRDGEQDAQPTPSISTPPANQSYVVYLPIAASDYVEGSGRYWGGQVSASRCPTCTR